MFKTLPRSVCENTINLLLDFQRTYTIASTFLLFFLF